MSSVLRDILVNIESDHDYEWWVTPRSLTGGKMVKPVDFVAEDLNGYIFHNHPELERWATGIARIAVGELRFGLSVNYLYELSDFKKILCFILCDHIVAYDDNLNGESYSSLKQKYLLLLKQKEHDMHEAIDNHKYTSNPNYVVKRIDSYSKMQPFGVFTASSSPWCVAYSERKYGAFAAKGANHIYVVFHKDFKDIPQNVSWHRSKSYLDDIGKNQESPYDDFGLSMLLIVTASDGHLLYCTSRWNHTYAHSSHDYLDEREISMLIGKNYYETFN